MPEEVKNRLLGAYYDAEYVLDYLLGEENFYQDEIDEHASRLADALIILKYYFKDIGIEIPNEEKES